MSGIFVGAGTDNPCGGKLEKALNAKGLTIVMVDHSCLKFLDVYCNGNELSSS